MKYIELNQDQLIEDSLLSKNISKIGLGSENSINSSGIGTSSFGGSQKSNYF